MLNAGTSTGILSEAVLSGLYGQTEALQPSAFPAENVLAMLGGKVQGPCQATSTNDSLCKQMDILVQEAKSFSGVPSNHTVAKYIHEVLPVMNNLLRIPCISKSPFLSPLHSH